MEREYVPDVEVAGECQWVNVKVDLTEAEDDKTDDSYCLRRHEQERTDGPRGRDEQGAGGGGR